MLLYENKKCPIFLAGNAPHIRNPEMTSIISCMCDGSGQTHIFRRSLVKPEKSVIHQDLCFDSCTSQLGVVHMCHLLEDADGIHFLLRDEKKVGIEFRDGE